MEGVTIKPLLYAIVKEGIEKNIEQNDLENAKFYLTKFDDIEPDDKQKAFYYLQMMKNVYKLLIYIEE